MKNRITLNIQQNNESTVKLENLYAAAVLLLSAHARIIMIQHARVQASLLCLIRRAFSSSDHLFI
jgi:hypothetical protein